MSIRIVVDYDDPDEEIQALAIAIGDPGATPGWVGASPTADRRRQKPQG